MANVIESFEFYDYRPSTSENIDALGTEFPITVYNEDIITQPCKSLLQITGKITVRGGANNAVVDPIATEKLNFSTNGFLHLFDRIDYFIGDNKIDSIRKPGISTTMKGLVSFESDLKYQNSGWNIKAPSSSVINGSGYFSVLIPLSTIMGFFEDYKHYLYRIPQKLVFYKVSSLPLSYWTRYDPTYTTATTVDLSLSEIVWKVPQIKFSLGYESKIRQEILNGTDYQLHYRTWLHQSISLISGNEYTWEIPTAYAKTKYILLAFQTDKNKPFFSLCNLENVQVLLNNNVYYPRERLNLKVADHKVGNLYHMFKTFKGSYYSMNESETEPLIDYDTFIKKYPIIAIDCSCQAEVIKESLINIKVLFSWRDAFLADTIIHCVLIMDDKAVYNPLTNRVIH